MDASDLTVPVNKCPLPPAGQTNGPDLLRTLIRERSPLAVLETIREGSGDHFQVQLPSFQAAFVTGPDAARQILVHDRDDFRWRNEHDPVARLLRTGVLVVDDEQHRVVRSIMEPSLRRSAVLRHVAKMVAAVDWVADSWTDEDRVDMLVEMRKIALIILMETLFGIDFRPVITPLWKPIFDLLHYIGPGPWLVWKGWQGKKYQAGIQLIHDYLINAVIDRRSRQPKGDMLDELIASGLSNDDIRDQMLTMLIAGHDTATALLAWAFAAFSQHPQFLARAQSEATRILADQHPGPEHLKDLLFLDTMIKETLRLFPPIHVSNRKAKKDVKIGGYDIDEDCRVMYSIYLSHRHPDYWEQPGEFRPERFDKNIENKRPPFVYLPFGGGPRNCIGATFAQIEAKIVLSRLLQRFDFKPLATKFRPHMGATLEPRPGVPYQVRRRH